MVRFVLLLVLGLNFRAPLHAQTPAVFSTPGFTGDTSPDGIAGSDGGPTVPFDNGMSGLLLAGAIGLGMRSYRGGRGALGRPSLGV